MWTENVATQNFALTRELFIVVILSDNDTYSF